MKKWKSILVYSIISLFLIFGTLGISTSYASSPGIWATNHVMAKDISYADGFYQASDVLAYFYGSLDSTWSFKTLDDFTCNKGYYSLNIRIVNDDTGQEVATLNTPPAINAETNGFIYTYKTSWTVRFPQYGWYSYEIRANGELVNSYSFYVRSSKI